eukprot:g18140.t1
MAGERRGGVGSSGRAGAGPGWPILIPCYPSLQYLLHYLVSLKKWMNRHTWERTPVAVTAWGALRDSYHGTVCLRHTPQHVAVAALYFALLCYGVEVPGDATGERAWWQ